MHPNSAGDLLCEVSTYWRDVLVQTSKPCPSVVLNDVDEVSVIFFSRSVENSTTIRLNIYIRVMR